ncbi:hypothetical protein OH799_25500 [Nocardia sp. NBC_00881]|uniref:hypothetical protein n=1 Tax=Nocardia sp. NBC_00881 TaxID=2975995 RepID=UPI003868F57D|nr:hypothetical protein OH799_25500 [Nocardia sp. NBC_00881]
MSRAGYERARTIVNLADGTTDAAPEVKAVVEQVLTQLDRGDISLNAARQHVRNMVHVRELVGNMMRSARRDLTRGDLGRLAQRVGVVPV